MTNVADTAPASGQQIDPPARTSVRGLLAQTEIDLRLFGMLVAFVVILVTFHVLSGGKLIAPTNMITMAVQATGIAIIATGMVLVIVSRNIDLSVGSLVGLIAMSYALWMTDWLPRIFGLGADVPFQLGARPRAGRSPWERPSVPSRASSSPTSACPRSSSRSAACSRSAASSWYQSERAGRHRPRSRPSSSSAVARRVGRRNDHLGPRGRRLRRARRAALQRPPAADGATASRSGRCGPRC